MTSPPTPLREQTRTVVRSLLARTALDLFAENGYEQTTVDDVAAAAGVSRRTLFNYFRTKEDLALSGVSEQGTLIAARFAGRPTDEDPWTSLRAAFRVIDEIDTSPENRLAFIGLLFGSATLRAGHAEKQAHWRDLLAPHIAARLPDGPHRELRAHAVAGAAISCLQVSLEEWLRRGGSVPRDDLFAIAEQSVRQS